MKLKDAKAKYPDAACFKFGDSRQLCDALLALVRAGKKQATCAALRDYRSGGEQMPEVGRQDIALDWDGNPSLVIETTKLTITTFRDVDETFALQEGENVDLAGWQGDHRDYFERNGGFDADMELVCEYFQLVEDFA